MPPRKERPQTIRDGLAGGLLLVVWSLIAAPIPAVNEPHYWTLARHNFDASWIPGDFFLNSVAIHVGFIQSLGRLTQVLPLEWAVLFSRVGVLTLFAFGWLRLLQSAGLSRFSRLSSLWILATLQPWLSPSGEWVIGGIESKVQCYTALLWAADAVGRGAPLRAGALAGLAFTFHPVSAAWAILSAAVGAACYGLAWIRAGRACSESEIPWSRPVLAVVLAGLLATPGIVGLAPLFVNPAPEDVRYAATYLQVFYRLPHHLDPMTFSISKLTLTALLIAVGGSVAWLTRGRWTHRPLAWGLFGAVLGAGLFWIVGYGLGWGPRPPIEMPGFEWRMRWLRFYPFRWMDVLLPGVVIAMTAYACLDMSRSRLVRTIGLGLVLLAPLPTLYSQAIAEPDFNTTTDWRTMAAWIREHTSPEAVVLTPRASRTFKWYAERAEYATFKDCPQDPAGIVEWNRRLRFLAKWFQDHFVDGYSADELRQLRQETGLTHILTIRLGPMSVPPVYQVGPWKLYELPGH